jgi:signal transduction histidine kinase
MAELAGRGYLPVAIGLYLVAPFASEVLELGHPFPEYTALARERLLMLLPPLLIVSWQYRFPVLVAFVLSTTVLDAGLTALVYPPESWIATDYLSIIVMRTLAFVACGALVSRLTSAHRMQREALQQANARLARYATTLEQLAVARERARLAWELHDTAAHALSALAVQLEAARSDESSDPVKTKTMLTRALATARQGLSETRRAIKALRGSALDEKGLMEALKELAASASARLGAVLTTAYPEDSGALAPELEALVYRVAQEALENCVRHSHATQLDLRFSSTRSKLMLEIADNGVGFEPRAIGSSGPDDRFGLIGMRERAELLGAQFEVASQSGRGTKIRLTMEFHP